MNRSKTTLRRGQEKKQSGGKATLKGTKGARGSARGRSGRRTPIQPFQGLPGRPGSFVTPELHLRLGSPSQPDDSAIPKRLNYTKGSLFIQREARNAFEKKQNHYQGNVKDASVPTKLAREVSSCWFLTGVHGFLPTSGLFLPASPSHSTWWPRGDQSWDV